MSHLEDAGAGHAGQRRGHWSRDRWSRGDGRLDRDADQFASFLSRRGCSGWNDVAAVAYVSAGRSGESRAAVAGTCCGSAAGGTASGAASGADHSGESIHVLYPWNSRHGTHGDTGSAGTEWYPRAADGYSGNSSDTGDAVSLSVIRLPSSAFSEWMRSLVSFKSRPSTTVVLLFGAPQAGRQTMPTLIPQPTRIQAAGNKPKIIDEYIGRVNSKTSAASVAYMRSPQGWVEPGQTPEFDEFTIVLKGTLRVEHRSGSLEVRAGQAVVAHAGEWVRYSTPEDDGAEYIAVCLPAFSMQTVHRDK